MTTIATSTESHNSNLNQHISSRKSSTSTSDEDIVHVVTNLYQIPVMQQQISNFNDSTARVTDFSGLSQLTQQIGGLNSHRGTGTDNNGELLFISDSKNAKTSSSIYTTSTQRILDENEMNIQNNAKQSRYNLIGVPVKEKYQIRSIVEIYENPNSNENSRIDLSQIKRNTTIEEIKKYETNIIKTNEYDDFVFSSKN